MKRLLIILLSGIIATEVYGQSSDIQLWFSVEDSSMDIDTVHFGVHPLATQCIDPALGEEELPFDWCPPWRPPGVVCVSFSDPPSGSCLGNGVRLDLRAFRSVTQIDTYRVNIAGIPPYIIRWPTNIGAYYDSAHLGDFFNGVAINVDMTATDSVLISNSLIAVPLIITRGPRIVTDISSEGAYPTAFALYPNYPNPFNSSTTIRYQLPIHTHVLIKVSDALGREVITLVNGMQDPGVHSVPFNAGGLGSGIYLYRILAGGIVQSGKMLFQK